MNSQELRNLQESYIDVYNNIMEKEDSPYEKASDAALDSRYGYGRATGDKHSFGRAANRSSAAAALPQTPAPLTTNDASAIPVTKGGRFLKTQRKKKIRNTSYKRKKYKNNNI